jgi:hypothetical protein
MSAYCSRADVPSIGSQHPLGANNRPLVDSSLISGSTMSARQFQSGSRRFFGRFFCMIATMMSPKVASLAM